MGNKLHFTPMLC